MIWSTVIPPEMFSNVYLGKPFNHVRLQVDVSKNSVFSPKSSIE